MDSTWASTTIGSGVPSKHTSSATPPKTEAQTTGSRVSGSRCPACRIRWRIVSQRRTVVRTIAPASPRSGSREEAPGPSAANWVRIWCAGACVSRLRRRHGRLPSGRRFGRSLPKGSCRPHLRQAFVRNGRRWWWGSRWGSATSTHQ